MVVHIYIFIGGGTREETHLLSAVGRPFVSYMCFYVFGSLHVMQWKGRLTCRIDVFGSM